MFRNKTKKANGKSFKYEEVEYELAYGKPVDDEGGIALHFQQGNETATYYGKTITKLRDYMYRTEGVEGTFEDIKTAMAAITMPGLIKGHVGERPD